jgi:asparaginyl-tRNA synthetase
MLLLQTKTISLSHEGKTCCFLSSLLYLSNSIQKMANALLSKSKEAVTDALEKATAAMQMGEQSKGSEKATRSTSSSEGEETRFILMAVRLILQSLAELPTYYVDEVAGNDETGDGSQALPYKTVVGAYIARNTTSLSLMIRKAEDAKTEVSTHTPAGTMQAVGYQPIAKSAQKKGITLFQQHQKKQARALELAAKEKDKEAADAKKLEEAKKVVLEQPAGDAKRIKIRQGVDNRDARIRVFGWVHRLRQQSGLTFIVLRDGTGYVQCVLSGKLVGVDS